ncbi:IclR family transcriptional regulator [Ruania alkalisoli]|uniref:Glycerol operon regulatory protein n=1 Tax=Ruania alkalisoli TaxID=2779775 RepID=A0A7M1STE3_9MICO|nr:IclR family transcriptional regulator [Ruania alkalisoli]QOR70830.1 IclR family transcriptional regulator [Ruania alkalisoli]
MADEGAQPLGVKSSERTLDILELLAHSDRGLTLTEISRELTVPKSSLHKLLATLERRGWVQTDEVTRSRYSVGLSALQAGTKFVDADEVVHLTEPVLTQISDRLGEATHLGRLDGTDIVYLAKRESTHHLRMFSAVGRRLPSHATAMGKAMLATMPPDAVDTLLGADRQRLTPHTLTSPDQLHAELARTRERGYGVDDEESAEMMRAVAIALPLPVPTLNAISVSAPTIRMPREGFDETAELIVDAVLAAIPHLSLHLPGTGA